MVDSFDKYVALIRFSLNEMKNQNMLTSRFLQPYGNSYRLNAITPKYSDYLLLMKVVLNKRCELKNKL